MSDIKISNIITVTTTGIRHKITAENKNTTVLSAVFLPLYYDGNDGCICDNCASIKLDCHFNMAPDAFTLTFKRFNRADQKKDSSDERERERERERGGREGSEKVRRGKRRRRTMVAATIAEVSVEVRDRKILSFSIALATPLRACWRAKHRSLAQVRRDGEVARWRGGEVARWRGGRRAKAHSRRLGRLRARGPGFLQTEIKKGRWPSARASRKNH